MDIPNVPLPDTLLRCTIFLGRESEKGHERRMGANASAAARPQTADPAGGQGGFRLGPKPASRAAKKIGKTSTSSPDIQPRPR
jgi:hypothetical protein